MSIHGSQDDIDIFMLIGVKASQETDAVKNMAGICSFALHCRDY